MRHHSFSANEFYQNKAAERPLFHRLLSSHHSVTNPNSPFDNYVVISVVLRLMLHYSLKILVAIEAVWNL